MSTPKTQRWLDLLSVLVGRRFPVSVDEIMEQVPGYRNRWERGDQRARASVRRMFERDKDELRSMGIPLETRRYRIEGLAETQGYVIPTRDFYLPYLKLISSEAGEGAAAGEGAEMEAAARDTSRPSDGTSSPPSTSPHAVGRVTLAESDAGTAILALRTALSLPSFPFRPEARSALQKLTFDLDPALDASPGSEDEAGPPIRILDRPGGADPAGALGILLQALYDRRRLGFRYHSIGRDVVEDREVEPWGLLFQWGAWYLAARDPAKANPDGEDDGAADVRLFRVDRMHQPRPTRTGPAGPDFQVPEAFDLRQHMDRKPWELGKDGPPELKVVVRFHPPASLLAMRNGWGEPAVGPEEKPPEARVPEEGDGANAKSGGEQDGAILRSFQVRRLDPFLRWVFSLAGEAEVVTPPSAAKALSAMAAKVLARYEEPF